MDINGEQHNLNRKTRFAFGKRKDRAVEMVDCELSMQEMAEMLGMTRDSLFVKQMFNRADKDNSGYLSMREFTDLIILLMDGKTLSMKTDPKLVNLHLQEHQNRKSNLYLRCMILTKVDQLKKKRAKQ